MVGAEFKKIVILKEFVPNNFNYIKGFYYDYEHLCPVTCTECIKSGGRSYCVKGSCTLNRIFDGLYCVNPPGTIEFYSKTDICPYKLNTETLVTFDDRNYNDRAKGIET